MSRMSSLAAALCCAAAVSCTTTEAAHEGAIDAERGTPAVTVTSSSITLADRVLPDGSVQASIAVTVANLPKKASLALDFTGDDLVWDADLPLTSASSGTFTFAGPISTSTQIGQHELSWNILRTDTAATIGTLVRTIEVTCADDDFCDGEERWSRGACADAKPACDDGEDCTDDHCDPAAKTCWHTPASGAWTEACNSCDAKNCNPKCAKNQQCGDDGCGGACTSQFTDDEGHCLGGLFCVAGTCAAVNNPGTCGNPLPLLAGLGYPSDTIVPNTGLTGTIFGNTADGLDVQAVSCGGEGIPEVVYEFEVQTTMGYEIRMLSATGVNDALDTVLAVHEEDCFTQAPGGWSCSDDATPPGGLGSLVRGMLGAGHYFVIATGYSASQVGPFQMQLKFVPSCVPTCDGKFCGDDSCGGECGQCSGTQTCGDDGRCMSGACVPSCSGRQCGSDGCDGDCGSCPSGQLCADAIGKCVPASTCDHLKPECGGCPERNYCGSDCQCHHIDEQLIDLIPAREEAFLDSVEFEWRTFTGTSCAIAEGCVPGAGNFLLMKFATDILNQGVAGFAPGDPTLDPSNFDYHECHQHYHFEGFAEYRLLTLDGSALQIGRKQSYCMEDSYQYLQGPSIACDPTSTCDDQGVQGGWADLYPNSLDCQWLVIATDPPAPDDVAMGQWYYHRTCTNTGRVFHEYNFDNNCIDIPVWIPPSVPTGTVVKYRDLTPPPFPQ